jgi:hypothetical protein
MPNTDLVTPGLVARTRPRWLRCNSMRFWLRSRASVAGMTCREWQREGRAVGGGVSSVGQGSNTVPCTFEDKWPQLFLFNLALQNRIRCKKDDPAS